MPSVTVSMEQIEDNEGRKSWLADLGGAILRGFRFSTRTLGDDEPRHTWTPQDGIYRCTATTLSEFEVHLPNYPENNAQGAFLIIIQTTDCVVRVVPDSGTELILPYPGADRTGGRGATLFLACPVDSRDNPPRWYVIGRTVVSDVPPTVA